MVKNLFIEKPQKKYRLGTVSKNILLEGLNRFHGANFTISSDVHQANSQLLCFGVQEFRDINNCIMFMLKAAK